MIHLDSEGTRGRHLYSLFLVLFAAAVFAWGCSSGGESGAGGDSEGGEGAATMAQPAGGEGMAAFSGAREAEARASDWRDDAQLYAVAAATPSLDARGRSPSWLYTYVSESTGAIMSVTVSKDGAEAAPAQELPEADINLILQNTLPDTAGMIDSPEATRQTREVVSILEENPDSQVSAGLDSFSGGEPEWIFATTRGEDRVEERTPAVAGGG